MEWWSVLLLGALQGLTEFLPVSSSGHLALAEHLLGLGEPPLLFNISLHVGTLAAILAIYGRDLLAAIRAGLAWLAGLPRGRWRPADDAQREAVGILVATAVTSVLGLALHRPLEAAATDLRLVGILFAACGLVLLATRWAPGGPQEVTIGRALLVGLAQTVAMLPGVSRSGMTIAAALFLGLARTGAARFSFLIAVPAILGAELVGMLGDLSGARVPAAQHLVGALVAGGVGFGALTLLVRLVHRGAFHHFGWYLVPLGIAVAAGLAG